MAKQGSTKDKILKLISEGDNNLSAISERLDLAPSTVSKHLQDLEISGAIVQKDNPHVKKWKYYQLNSGAIADKTETKGSQQTETSSRLPHSWSFLRLCRCRVPLPAEQCLQSPFTYP